MLTGFWWSNLRKEATWKTTHRWEDNTKIGLKEKNGRAYSGVVWLGIESNGDIFVNKVMIFRVHLNAFYLD
jgi:hypothetical protein